MTTILKDWDTNLTYSDWSGIEYTHNSLAPAISVISLQIVQILDQTKDGELSNDSDDSNIPIDSSISDDVNNSKELNNSHGSNRIDDANTPNAKDVSSISDDQDISKDLSPNNPNISNDQNISHTPNIPNTHSTSTPKQPLTLKPNFHEIQKLLSDHGYTLPSWVLNKRITTSDISQLIDPVSMLTQELSYIKVYESLQTSKKAHMKSLDNTQKISYMLTCRYTLDHIDQLVAQLDQTAI